MVAFFLQALVHFQPKCIAITGGYHGFHNSISVYKKANKVKIIGLEDDFEEGTLCWLETPLNPTGESRLVPSSSNHVVILWIYFRNIQYYADKVSFCLWL